MTPGSIDPKRAFWQAEIQKRLEALGITPSETLERMSSHDYNVGALARRMLLLDGEKFATIFFKDGSRQEIQHIDWVTPPAPAVAPVDVKAAMTAAAEAAIRKHIAEAALDSVMNEHAIETLTSDLCFVVQHAIHNTAIA